HTQIPSNSLRQQGVLVIGVEDHTFAQSIGLSKGSVIETVAGLNVHNLEELGKFLRSNLGNKIGITWKDQTGHQINQFVTLPKYVEPNQGILGISITNVAPDPAQALRSYKDAFSLSSNPSSHFLLLLPPTIGAGVQSVPYSNVMAPKYQSSVIGSAFAPFVVFFFYSMLVIFLV